MDSRKLINKKIPKENQFSDEKLK